MQRLQLLAASALCLLATSTAVAQPPIERLARAIEAAKDGCAMAQSAPVRICRYDFTVDGQVVEALSFQPPGAGPFPAVLMIPGFASTAWQLAGLGVRLGSAGIAAVAVTQPGFGGSAGPPDYVGPKTIKVLTAAYRKFQREPFVDARRMGIYGFSRGGMAASLLAVKLDDVKAAVFGAGIYDFKRAYDETTMDGIRGNMRAETGMTAEAVRERSSILDMEKLACPVLILHGEKDARVSVSQALALRDRLTALGKPFEIQLFPHRPHGIGPEVDTLTVDFFRRQLQPAPGT
jgi:dipeptidyl aminopeptidase/acylaminoacyl peptidase